MAADRPRQRRRASTNSGRAAVAALALASVLALALAGRAAVAKELTAWTDLAQQAVRTFGVQGPMGTR